MSLSQPQERQVREDLALGFILQTFSACLLVRQAPFRSKRDSGPCPLLVEMTGPEALNQRPLLGAGLCLCPPGRSLLEPAVSST